MSFNSPNKDREEKKKKKEGYAAFYDYLKKAEKTCKQINQLDDWAQKLRLADEIVQDIPGLLETYGEFLSKQAEKKLKEMLGFSNIYSKAPLGSCAKLIARINDVLNELNVSVSANPIEPSQSTVSSASTTTSSGTSTISPTIIIVIAVAVATVAVVGGTCTLGIICPQDIPPPTLVYPQNEELENVSEINFRWSDSSDRVDHYILEITNLNTKLMTREQVDGNSFTASNLDVGSYSWKIKVVDSSGKESKFSNIGTFRISDTIGPSSPKLYSPNNNSYFEKGQSPTLKWSSDETDVMYLVEITNKNTGKKDTQSVSGKSFTASNLDVGSYSWKIKAEDSAGNESIFSDSFNFIIQERDTDFPPTPILNRPTNGSTLDTNTVEFSWNRVFDDSGIKNYIIEVFTVTDRLQFTSNLISTTHERHLSDGIYKWHVRAVDGKGNVGYFSDFSLFTIDTQRFSPITCFEVTPDNPNVGSPVIFDASCSNDPDGFISSYIWNFDDGTTDSGITTTHTYSSDGPFTVTLTVVDNDDLADTKENVVHLTPIPLNPTACFIPSSNLQVGIPIQFDASCSNDPDGFISSYIWNFDDGTTDSGITTTHTYSSDGPFTVTLTVVDNDDLQHTDNVTLDVIPVWTFATISLDKASYTSSDKSAFIQVIDPDSSNFITVKASSNANPTGIQITLRETGDSTRMFQGRVIFSCFFSDQSTNKLEMLAVGGDAILVEYQDTKVPPPRSSYVASDKASQSFNCIS